MSGAYLNYSDDDEEPATSKARGGRDNKREKRLERNRESARKCRRKRKAYVGDLEGKCAGLEEENAMLQLENDRLHELIQQLQSGVPVAKRAKSEFGVTAANDLSESAAGELFTSAGHRDYHTAPSQCDADDLGAISDDTFIGGSSNPSASEGGATLHGLPFKTSGIAAETLDGELAHLIPQVQDSSALPEIKVEKLDELEIGPNGVSGTEPIVGDNLTALIDDFAADSVSLDECFV